jgi:hypothetical protein
MENKLQSFIRKILGEVSFNLTRYGVAKTDCGRFVVGRVAIGLPADQYEQFDTLEDAFNHWYKTLPTRTSTIGDHNHYERHSSERQSGTGS